MKQITLFPLFLIFLFTFNSLAAIAVDEKGSTQTMDPAITALVLVNATNNQDIMTLVDGMAININDLPSTSLSIRAEGSGTIGSVQMVLTGPVSNTRTENVAPYALFGDGAGNYYGREFGVGSYGISATPYDGRNLGGNPGSGLDIQFTIGSGTVSSAFITRWKTNNIGISSDDQITIPTFPGETYDYSVDWGDGNVNTGVTGNITHSYGSSGIYTVSITGVFPRIYFNNEGDRHKLLSVEQWGVNPWSSMESAFHGCVFVDVLATDIPDLSNVTSSSFMFNNCSALEANSTIGDWNVSNVTSMFRMFLGATLFNQDIGNWNVGNVTDMGTMFGSASAFNQDIGNWDLSSATNIGAMFAGASSFNQDIGQWDVSKVVYIEGMFSGAISFNQNIGGWNTAAATDMDVMFLDAASFDQNIGDWDVGNVNSMASMFEGASTFNQDLSNWNVGKVEYTTDMFKDASAFDQNLGAWDVSKVKSMYRMFEGVALSTENYDALLTGWSSLSNLQTGVQFDGGNSQYCQGANARQELKGTYGWTITDGGEDPLGQGCTTEEKPFVTTWKTDNPGVSGDNQITIPTFPDEIYDYAVDWGDGTTDTNVKGEITHTYSSPGTYVASISGNFPRIFFNHISNSQVGDQEKLININQWGDVNWSSMDHAFAGCINLDVVADDVPKLGQVSNAGNMFNNCISLIGNASFESWKVGNISDMKSMFSRAEKFNQDIGSWDVSRVNNMNNMFSGASNFNQDISAWDVSNCPRLSSMFMSTAFNQDIGSWDMGSAANIGNMFKDSPFNQDISGWNIENVHSMRDIFDNSALSDEYYDNILIGWSQLPSLQSAVEFGAPQNFYCSGMTARSKLINDYGWTITDAGISADCGEPQRPFITTWKTDNEGPSSDNQITIPTFPGETYNYSVDWGDGSTSSNIIGDVTHTYASPGIYSVSITGNFPRIYLNNTGDKFKLLLVNQWGDIVWTSMQNSFYGCDRLDLIALDVPNLSGAPNLNSMFRDCVSLIGNSKFSEWNLSQATNIGAMFSGARIFQGPIGNWDVSSVTNMVGTFAESNFNRNIQNWDVSNVLSMEGMFSGATAFNQPIGNWDVSQVQNMFVMFASAEDFDQNLGNWDVSAVTEMGAMLFGTNLSVENYDALLEGWSNLPSLQNNVQFDAGNNSYCSAITARQHIIDTYGWTINDGGQAADCIDTTSFITTWKTDNPGTSEDNQITIPTHPGEAYNYAVDWGDGASDSGVTGNITHTYETQGEYQVSISGNFPRIFFNGFGENLGDARKMISIAQWGDQQWSSMQGAFAGCSNLDMQANDIPDFSNLNSLDAMFRFCSSLVGNSSLGQWEVSNVTSMGNLFDGATLFNQDIGSWDVSNVIYLSFMFNSASSFNQDIGNWDVSKVTYMSSVFGSAVNFNQYIGNWDVSNVIEMHATFAGASAFNQDIGSWDMSKVQRTDAMFSGATSFNQNIENWDVGNVTTMNVMFVDASSFNQDIGGWNVANVSDMTAMFSGVTLSTENYDALLEGWSTLPSLQIAVNFDGGNSLYCQGTDARQDLIDTYGWTIFDGDQAADCIDTTSFITTWKTDNPGNSEDNQITIPTFPGEAYNYTVNWGDGTITSGVNGDITHTYDSIGTYTVSISGDFPRIYFRNQGDASKLILVEQWGDIAWTSMEDSFSGCSAMDVTALDVPNFSNVNSTRFMFSNCSSLIGNHTFDQWNVSNITTIQSMFRRAFLFNQPIGSWDTSNVTSLNGMFQGAEAFDQPIGNWNTSNVSNMQSIFANAKAFNQPLNSWDISNVMILTGAFLGATSFNQPLDNWNLGNVYELSDVFAGATNFNQDIGSWNVSNVLYMVGLFERATNFNQDIGNWDVSNVTTLLGTFSEATAFDQNLGNWNVSQVTNMIGAFSASGLSDENYDNILIGWNQLPTLQPGVRLDAPQNNYCLGTDARQNLIDTYGWTITDGGLDLVNCQNPTLSITDFVLVDAITDEDLLTLVAGDNIDLNSLPTSSFNVRANTTGDVSSVRLELAGTLVSSRIEGKAPYALFGDSNGNYLGRQMPAGPYTLSATPYSAPRATGDAGNTATINFTFNNNAAKGSDTFATATYDIELYPNAASEAVNISVSDPAVSVQYFVVYDVSGRQVGKYSANEVTSGTEFRLPVNQFQAGIYFVMTVDTAGRVSQNQLVVK